MGSNSTEMSLSQRLINILLESLFLYIFVNQCYGVYNGFMMTLLKTPNNNNNKNKKHSLLNALILCLTGAWNLCHQSQFLLQTKRVSDCYSS